MRINVFYEIAHRTTFGFISAVLLTMLVNVSVYGQDADPESQWQSLNALVMESYQKGAYTKAIEHAQQALKFTNENFEADHPNTVTSLINLGTLYDTEARYNDAEPLFAEALARNEKVFGEDHPNTLNSLQSLADVYNSQGRYSDAEPLFIEALARRERALGEDHPYTLTSLNSLALLYHSQGRYGDAEPLFTEGLTRSKKVLGEDHPNTLRSQNNLALLYQSQGRYDDADTLYTKVLSDSRRVLGEDHPNTISSLGNLSALYHSLGRYGEAKPLAIQALARSETVLGEDHPSTLIRLNNLSSIYNAEGNFEEAATLRKTVLARSERALGEDHPNTLVSLNNLAQTYQSQGRFGTTESLYTKALDRSKRVLGEEHPNTLISLSNLAGLYHSQGSLTKAEPMAIEALALSEKVLGKDHPNTLISLRQIAGLFRSQGNFAEAESRYIIFLDRSKRVLGEDHPVTIEGLNALASMYHSLKRYAEAESLQTDAEVRSKRVLGENHPLTLASVANLAALYHSQERYGEAEQLYTDSLARSKKVLGENHPGTLTSLNNLAILKVLQGRVDDAIQLILEAESVYLSRLGVEIYSSSNVGVRRKLAGSTAGYQNLLFSMALGYSSYREAQQLAARSVLKFKGMLAEEEAWIAQLTRQSDDPTLHKLTMALSNARRTLATAYENDSDRAVIDTLLDQINQAELNLGRHSREHAEQLQVRTSDVVDLVKALPQNSKLIEFYRFRTFDFADSSRGEPKFAAVVFGANSELRVVDLGSTAGVAEQVQSLMDNADDSETAGAALYQRLIEPLGLSESVEQLFIAPDAELHMLPFYRLKNPSGQYMGSRFKVRQIQSGRDLLREYRHKAGKGLLAIGGITYGPKPAANEDDFEASEDLYVAEGPALEETQALRTATAEAFRTGFEPLPSTGPEVRYISQLYRQARPDEAEHMQLWLGNDASEQRLSNLKSAPRVLHLATHGFYRDQENRGERPMLLSGIALAGANEAVAGDRDDGVLYALEAQSLNLEGTELVVLSACETGQGKIDYGEGVYGLVRALRTAGAKQVLMTLRPVEDASAERFMRQFYKRWLSQPEGDNDAASALDETRAYYIENEPDFDWSPYVLIGV